MRRPSPRRRSARRQLRLRPAHLGQRRRGHDGAADRHLPARRRGQPAAAARPAPVDHAARPGLEQPDHPAAGQIVKDEPGQEAVLDRLLDRCSASARVDSSIRAASNAATTSPAERCSASIRTRPTIARNSATGPAAFALSAQSRSSIETGPASPRMAKLIAARIVVAPYPKRTNSALAATRIRSRVSRARRSRAGER